MRRDIPALERRYWTAADYKDLLFTRTATEVGNAILAGIYPIKVNKVSNNEVVLNRGSGVGIDVGQYYLVLKQGETITDIDTGELLGGAEIQVGMVEVTSVSTRLSTAKIISGVGQIIIGDICRLQKSIIIGDDAAYPRVTPGW